MIGFFAEAFISYLLSLPILVAFEWLLVRSYRRAGIGVSAAFIIGWQVFAYLLAVIFHTTGTAGIADIGRYGGELIPNPCREISFIPFKGGIWTFGTVANAIMFMPVGFMLPLLWKRCERALVTIGTGAALSLAIEISQLFNRRVTDIDDLIMNTIGCAIGFTLFMLFRTLAKSSSLTVQVQKPPHASAAGFVVRHGTGLTIIAALVADFTLVSLGWSIYEQTLIATL